MRGARFPASSLREKWDSKTRVGPGFSRAEKLQRFDHAPMRRNYHISQSQRACFSDNNSSNNHGPGSMRARAFPPVQNRTGWDALGEQ